MCPTFHRLIREWDIFVRLTVQACVDHTRFGNPDNEFKKFIQLEKEENNVYHIMLRLEPGSDIMTCIKID